MQGLPLSGFNNLSKTLVCNLYEFCYVENLPAYQQHLQQYDDARALEQLLSQLASAIDAHIIRSSRVDYQPQGASLNLLLADKHTEQDWDAHLDKSHIHVHTYPDNNPDAGVHIFRLDIDIATCGNISPLAALAPLLDLFPASVIRLDYHIRGFTRGQQDKRHYRDQPVAWIGEYLSPEQRQNYQIRQQHWLPLRASYAHFLSQAPQRLFLKSSPAMPDYHAQLQQQMQALYLAI